MYHLPNKSSDQSHVVKYPPLAVGPQIFRSNEKRVNPWVGSVPKTQKKGLLYVKMHDCSPLLWWTIGNLNFLIKLLHNIKPSSMNSPKSGRTNTSICTHTTWRVFSVHYVVHPAFNMDHHPVLSPQNYSNKIFQPK